MTVERRVRLLRIGVLYIAVASLAIVGVRFDLLKANPPVAASESDFASPAPDDAASPIASAPVAVASATPVAVAADATSAPAAIPAPPSLAKAQGEPSTLTGASADASGAESYGDDLMNETYYATDHLDAQIVSPVADYVANANAPIVLTTVEGAGVELAIGNEVISHRNLGKRSVDHKTHVTTYEYFGLKLKPGENILRITALGKDGMRGETTMRKVYVGGIAAHVHGGLPSGTKLRADGRTAVPFTVTGIDAWKHPVGDGVPVRVSITAGDAAFQNVEAPKPAATAVGEAQPAQPTQTAAPLASPTPSGNSRTITMQFKNGVATAMLVPGLQAGDIVVAVRSGDVSDDETYFVSPFLRKAFVNGIVQAGAGSVPGNIDGDGELDNGGSRRGRLAVYATGAVGHDTTATVAYETQNRLAPSTAYGPYIENPNDRPYQSYGDTSSRRDDAISNDRLYGRIEHNRDTLTYGRVDVNTSSSELATGYSQQVSGLKANLSSGDGRSRLMLFQSRNDLGYAREIFNASGLATVGQVAHGNIVVGSESITVVSLDRRTGAVANQTGLTPNVDYTIDDVSGSLHFINVPSPFDTNLNPQVLLVTYQYYGTQASGAKTLGGRGEIGFGMNGMLKLGLGYINDVTGAGNFGLVNTDISGKLPGGMFAFGYTQSNGVSPANTTAGLSQTGEGGSIGLNLNQTSGRAIQGKFRDRLLGTDLAFDYGSTSIGYTNPFGGFSTPGFTNMTGSLHRKLGRGGELALTYSGQQNTGYGSTSTQSTLGFTAQQSFGKAFQAHIGLQRNSSGGTLAPIPVAASAAIAGATAAPVATSFADSGSVTQLEAGATWTLRKGTALTIERTADIAGTPALTSPSQTNLALSTDLTKTIKAYARESWSSSPYVSFANSTSAYTAPVSGTRSLALGLAESLGPTLSADQELSLNHTANGEDVLISQGVREHLDLGKHFASDLSLQTSRGTEQVLQSALAANGTPTYGFSNASNGYNAYNVALGYANEHNFRLSGSYQLRTGDSGGSTINFGGGGPIGTDFSVLGSIQKANGVGINSNDSRLGFSYRPTDNDRGVSLFEYERHDGVTYGSTREDIMSFDQLYRPTNRLELAGRVAYKLDGNQDYAAHTVLFGARATQRIGSFMDVATEASWLNSPGISGAAQSEFAVEAGFRVLDRVRLGIGYNFQGAADPTLLNSPTRKGVYVTFTSIVDRIFGWGAH